MNTTILLVGLVVFAFAVSRVLTRYAARYFVVSGVEYILLGALLGPVTGVLQQDDLATFAPLIQLLLGLLGFVQGLRARELLTRPRVLFGGMLSALLVIAVTGATCLVVIEAIGEGMQAVTYGSLPLGDRLLIVAASPDNLRLAGTIGCCAAVSSPVLVGDSARVLRARGPACKALIEQGEVSQLVALGVFGGILASARASESAAELQIAVGFWALGIALFGVLAGLLFIQFIGPERDEMRIYIAAVGVVTFASGIGVALDVSPLVVNLIAGACVSLDPRYARHVERTITRLRHPSLVLVRVFSGAAWVGVRGLAWVLPPLYAGIRLGVRWATGGLMLRAGPNRPRVPRVGLGLVGQGGYAVAIALSFALRFPDRAGVVLTAVLGGLVLSDLWSHRAVRRVLADAGELQAIPVAEAEAEHARQTAGEAGIHHPPPDGADDETLAAEGHRAVGAVAAADEDDGAAQREAAQLVAAQLEAGQFEVEPLEAEAGPGAADAEPSEPPDAPDAPDPPDAPDAPDALDPPDPPDPPDPLDAPATATATAEDDDPRPAGDTEETPS